jgi:hypothetical protein
MNKRVALFAVMLSVGLLAAPGIAQDIGMEDVAEEIDVTEDAEAHVDAKCVLEPCICYFDDTGYHCHYGY